jgi:hypothetical protein
MLGFQADGGQSAMPVRITLPGRATDIGSGSYYACAVIENEFACAETLADGTIRCWGDKGSGELGNGGSTSSIVPEPLAFNETFAQLRGGYHFMCGLASGAVECWGNAEYGQTGNHR